MVNTCCNSHTGLSLPFSAVTVTAFGIRHLLAIYSCSCASAVVFLEGGSNGNSQICILNKRCDLYSYGRSGRITHTRLLPGNRGETEGWKKGERGKINWRFSQEEKDDCALKIHSRVVLLQSIFGTCFPPRFTPNATLFWDFLFFYNLSHWYKVCSFQRHNKCADFVLCSPPPYGIHPPHWPSHRFPDTR